MKDPRIEKMFIRAREIEIENKRNLIMKKWNEFVMDKMLKGKLFYIRGVVRE